MTRIAKLFGAHTADELCDLIEREDSSLQVVADLWGCTKSQLQLWINSDSHRAQRAREARENAAETCDRKAEQVLLDLRSSSTVAEVARARELAQHYRWQAKVRNPANYGDKVQVDHGFKEVDPSTLSDAQLAAIIAASAVTIEGECELVQAETPGSTFVPALIATTSNQGAAQ